MTQFTTGALQSVIVTSNGNLGGIFTKRMASSSIEAGIVATVAPLSLPLTTSDFKNTSSIAAITIPKSASASFSNSYVAAYTINTASLGSVSMTNNTSPGTAFGIAAHKVSLATLFVQQGGNKQVHVTNPATNAVFDNVLTAKGITPADFEVARGVSRLVVTWRLASPRAPRGLPLPVWRADAGFPLPAVRR